MSTLISHPPVTPEDDLFHARTDHPHWNESSIICFGVPKRNLSGYLYIYHRPNMNLSAAGVGLWNGWDGAGEEIYDCLYHEWNEHMALPKGAEMFDWQLENNMSWRTLELGKSYRIQYEGRGYKIDATWTAIMDPHELQPERDKPDQINIGIQGWIDENHSRHYEHIGRLVGSLEYEGERVEIDDYALRDRSWGPRTLKGAVRCAWPWAAASDTHNFQVYAVHPRGWADDPIRGATDRVTGGWYMKDGQRADLISGTRRCERGEDGRPLVEYIDAVDSVGRELHAVGRMTNVLKWPCYNEWFDFWSMAEWEFDGVKAQGENHDYTVFRHYHQMWRQNRPVKL